LSLALVLSLLGLVTSEIGMPASLADHTVAVESLGWKALVDKEGQRWAVMVRPSGNSALDVAGIILQKRLVEALANNGSVRSVAGAPPDRNVGTLADEQLAMRLADVHDATRILLVHLAPGPQGAAPSVVLNVLDRDGKVVASTTSTSVLVPTQARGGEGVLAGPLLEERSDEQPVAPAQSKDEAREEFMRRALVAREQDDDDVSKPGWVILRDGKELTAAELQEVGAPGLAAGPRAGFWARKWPLVVFGSLEAVAAALPAVGCLLGVAGGMAFCSSAYAAWSMSYSATSQSFLDGAGIGCCYGCYLCPATGLGGLVVGGALALVTAGVGVAGMLFAPRAGNGDQAVQAFVTEHNKALARELGLRQSRLPARFFRAK
jgi:hypothetical protein